MISGGACAGNRANCYISAHDALTGKEALAILYDSGARRARRRKLGRRGGRQAAGIHLGTARRLRSGAQDALLGRRESDARPAHRCGMTAIPTRSRAPRPSDLYSNSTIALDPATGKLAWYYQHLPGDDWDSDYTHERTLVRTRLNPDPKYVKWINPDIPRGQERDVAVTVGEAGGVFELDRATGQVSLGHAVPV